ncbi:MAG: hypothetical protein C0614_04485, partial [Desulfuromonas sp.]
MEDQRNNGTPQAESNEPGPAVQVEIAIIADDGTISIPKSQAQLTLVEVADIDLLLSFADGSFVIIPGGALDATSGQPPIIVFLDDIQSASLQPENPKILTLNELFQQAEIVDIARKGVLRVASSRLIGTDADEEFDVNNPDDSENGDSSPSQSSAPPQRVTSASPMVDFNQSSEPSGDGAGRGGNVPNLPPIEVEEQENVPDQVVPRPVVYEDALEIENVSDAILVIDRNITDDDIINIAEQNSTIPITGRVYGDADTGDLVTLTVNDKVYSAPINPVDYIDEETGQVDTILSFSIDVPGADLVADSDSSIDGSLTTIRETVFDQEDYRVDVSPPKPTIDLDQITEDNRINLQESGEPIAITGKVGGDALSGDTVTLTINGQEYTGLVGEDFLFSIEVPGSALITDEDQTVEASIVTADDTAGNPSEVGTDSKTYLVDVEAPVVAAEQTLSYEENQSPGDVIAAVAVSDNVGVEGFRFTDSGTSESLDGFYTITENGQILLTETGSRGAHNDFEDEPNSFDYSIEAVDAAGNWSAAETITLRVTNLDEQAPVVASDQSFIYDQALTSGSVVATVAAEDDVGVTNFRFAETGNNLSANGQFRIAPNGQISLVSGGGGAGGTYDLRIEAGDAAGNWSTPEQVELKVIAIQEIDATPPVIPEGQILSYAENQTANNAVGTVAASDAVGVTSFKFSATGNDLSEDGFFRVESSGRVFITEEGIAAGVAQNDFETGENSFAYSFQAGDAAGNWSAAVAVILDVSDVDESSNTPTVTLVNDTGIDAADRITSDGSWTVGNLESGATVEYSLDSTDGTDGTWSTTLPTIGADDTYSFYVRQVDDAGNMSPGTAFSFTLDTQTTAPIVALLNDTGPDATDGVTSDGRLDVTGVEAGGLVEYSLDGGSNWSSSFTPVSGLNDVTVRVTDVAGNTSSTPFIFTFDKTAPS